VSTRDLADFLLRRLRLETEECYRAVRRWRPQADAGDASAAYQVGRALLTSRLPGRALPYLRQAAEGDLLEAMEELAAVLARRNRPDESQTWYEWAGDLARAQGRPAVQVGDYYCRAHQSEQAEQALRPAAEQDDARAAARLGDVLEYPWNGTRRPVEAAHWYSVAWALGDKSVGPALERLRFEARLAREEEQRFRPEAERGDPEAARRLASALRTAGRIEEADQWERQADQLWMDQYYDSPLHSAPLSESRSPTP